jgi:hypothetical protein
VASGCGGAKAYWRRVKVGCGATQFLDLRAQPIHAGFILPTRVKVGPTYISLLSMTNQC